VSRLTQRLHRNSEFRQGTEYIFIAVDDVIVTSHLQTTTSRQNTALFHTEIEQLSYSIHFNRNGELKCHKLCSKCRVSL